MPLLYVIDPDNGQNNSGRIAPPAIAKAVFPNNQCQQVKCTKATSQMQAPRSQRSHYIDSIEEELLRFPCAAIGHQFDILTLLFRFFSRWHICCTISQVICQYNLASKQIYDIIIIGIVVVISLASFAVSLVVHLIEPKEKGGEAECRQKEVNRKKA